MPKPGGCSSLRLHQENDLNGATLTQLAPHRKHTHTNARRLSGSGPDVWCCAPKGLFSHAGTSLLLLKERCAGGEQRCRHSGRRLDQIVIVRGGKETTRSRLWGGGATTATHANGSGHAQHPHVLGFFRWLRRISVHSLKIV